MNDLMIFQGHEVEVFEWNGKVLFNPYHCGECLELGESAVRMALSKMNDNQVIKLTNSDVKDIDIRKLNNAGENFLTESGVFKLIFKSHKPDAEKFQDWVTDEVLPSIGKRGIYTLKRKKAKTKTPKQPTLSATNTAMKMIIPELKAAGVDPVQLTYFLKDTYAPVGIDIPMIRKEQEKLYELTEIAEVLGIYSKTGKPHVKAIGAILSELDIDKNNIVKTSFSKNGYTDISNQYKKPVLHQVENWLKENGYPTVISNATKKFDVHYKDCIKKEVS